jgi:hypothetical protein
MISFASAGLALLGKIDEQMIEVTPVYEPTSDGKAENAFISKVCPLPFSYGSFGFCVSRTLHSQIRRDSCLPHNLIKISIILQFLLKFRIHRALSIPPTPSIPLRSSTMRASLFDKESVSHLF